MTKFKIGDKVKVSNFRQEIGFVIGNRVVLGCNIVDVKFFENSLGSFFESDMQLVSFLKRKNHPLTEIFK